MPTATTTTTQKTPENTFWKSMDRAVGSISAERTIGENGAHQWGMTGLVADSSRTEQIQGALVAAFAGLARGCSKQRVRQFLSNIITEARGRGDGVRSIRIPAFQFRIQPVQRPSRLAGPGEHLRPWLLAPEIWRLQRHQRHLRENRRRDHRRPRDGRQRRPRHRRRRRPWVRRRRAWRTCAARASGSWPPRRTRTDASAPSSTSLLRTRPSATALS